MALEPEYKRGEKKGLVTEKDIDPEFGLFTDEEQVQALDEISEQLLEQYPYEDMHAAPTQSDSEAGHYEPDSSEEITEELAAVPDADVIAGDTPVDPAAAAEEFHGTDLLNGVGHNSEQEQEREER